MPEEVSCSKIHNVYVISANTGRYDWVTLVIVCEMELFFVLFSPVSFTLSHTFKLSHVTGYCV